MNQNVGNGMMSVMGMQKAIGMESFYVWDMVYTDEVFAGMSLQDLEELKIRLNSEMVAISTALKTEQIKSDMIIDPMVEPKSPEWYITTHQALGKYARFMPYLSALIKRRKLSIRTIEGYFMDVAREHLDPNDFNFILSEAKSRHEAAGEKNV